MSVVTESRRQSKAHTIIDFLLLLRPRVTCSKARILSKNRRSLTRPKVSDTHTNVSCERFADFCFEKKEILLSLFGSCA